MKLLASPHNAPRTAARASLSLIFAVIASLVAASGCNDYGNTFQTPTGAPISFIAPSQGNAGGAGFTISVASPSGGFVTQTVVQWNGKTIPTTFVSASSVTATVTAAMIAKAGTVAVNTLNPFSGAGNNGLSNTLTFLINPAANPVPSITAISPSAATAGGASFTLTVTGADFIPMSDPTGGSLVRFNLGPTQATLPVLSVTTTQITA